MNNYTQYNGSSLYGNYRTRTFSDIFHNAANFFEEWQLTPFAENIETINTELIFMLLYSRYGNSNIAASDENRFKYQLFSLIFQYAPTWQKELDIQKQIRTMDISTFREGSRNIINNAANPSSAPSTQSTEELPYINNQNVSKSQKSLADGYAYLLSLLKDDVTESFLKRFEKLFLTIVEPEEPLWYVTYSEV